jgi:glycosyltransferase involved in cell wall biosynthesis
MPFISIIVPVYKVESYLRECLDSVLAQTFTDYECVLVDDGSPDNCPAICDEYAVKYPQMKVIHKENGGLSDARNAGILVACGEYIVLLDSDDLFAAEDALENFYRLIVYTKPSVVCSGNITVFDKSDISNYDEYDKKKYYYTPLQFYKETIKHKISMFGGCLFSIRRNFLLENALFFKKGLLHEDMHWIPCVLSCADIVVLNHSFFYKYRINRDSSITSNMYPKRLSDQLLIIQDLFFFEKESSNAKSKAILRAFCTNMWMSIYTDLLLLENRNGEYKKIINSLNEISFVLLYDSILYSRRIKRLICYILIKIFGIDNALKLRLFYLKLRKHPCYSTIKKSKIY